MNTIRIYILSTNKYFGTLFEYKVNTFCTRNVFACTRPALEYHGKYIPSVNEYIWIPGDAIRYFAVVKMCSFIFKCICTHIVFTNAPMYSIKNVFRFSVGRNFGILCYRNILYALLSFILRRFYARAHVHIQEKLTFRHLSKSCDFPRNWVSSIDKKSKRNVGHGQTISWCYTQCAHMHCICRLRTTLYKCIVVISEPRCWQERASTECALTTSPSNEEWRKNTSPNINCVSIDFGFITKLG